MGEDETPRSHRSVEQEFGIDASPAAIPTSSVPALNPSDVSTHLSEDSYSNNSSRKRKRTTIKVQDEGKVLTNERPMTSPNKGNMSFATKTASVTINDSRPAKKIRLDINKVPILAKPEAAAAVNQTPVPASAVAATPATVLRRSRIPTVIEASPSRKSSRNTARP